MFITIFFWNVFYIYAMHNRHILQHIMQCVVSVVYIVICNTVRLIVRIVMLQDVTVMVLCGSFSVHTNRYLQIFLG